MRKLGRIKISTEDLKENIEETSRILSLMGFVAFRMENHFFSGQIEYSGYSPMFDSLLEHETIPLYSILIKDSVVNLERKGLSFVRSN